MARIVMVIAEKGFRDEEFAIPQRILKDAGHEVTVASTSSGEAQGKLGMRVIPDITIDRINPQRYDAIVVVGGPGTPTYIWPNSHLQRALRAINKQQGVVAAICLAPVALARAGLLKGKKCTVFLTEESESEIRDSGGILLDKPTVVDGRIVTGNGPAAAKQFGEAILKLLG